MDQMSTASGVARALNERFLRGGVASDLSAAGLLLHTFDRIDDADPSRTPWVPKGGVEGDPSNRISASLISAAMPPEPGGELPTYSFGLAGTVLSPTQNRLRCSYAVDQGSIRLQTHAWGPGCGVPHAGVLVTYGPEHLDQMLLAHAARNRTHGRPNPGGFVEGRGRFYNEARLVCSLLLRASCVASLLAHARPVSRAQSAHLFS